MVKMKAQRSCHDRDAAAAAAVGKCSSIHWMASLTPQLSAAILAQQGSRMPLCLQHRCPHWWLTHVFGGWAAGEFMLHSGCCVLAAWRAEELFHRRLQLASVCTYVC